MLISNVLSLGDNRDHRDVLEKQEVFVLGLNDHHKGLTVYTTTTTSVLGEAGQFPGRFFVYPTDEQLIINFREEEGVAARVAQLLFEDHFLQRG